MFNFFSILLINCILISNLAIIKVYASDNIDVKAWVQTPETSYPTICNKEQIEIFSCPSKSKETIAICMNSANKKMFFAYQENLNIKNLKLDKIKQIVNIPKSGASTILQAETKKGLFRLYFDENINDNPSAVTMNGKVSFECVHNQEAYRTPTNIVKSAQGKDEIVNIWQLKLAPLLKEQQKNNSIIYNEKIGDLWDSWPK